MYRLPKSHRLHLRRSVEEVFAQGKSFVAYPLRVVYILGEAPLSAQSPSPRAQMMVSVPKKYFKRATARNRIKRLVREAYRLHQPPLLECLSEQGRYLRIGWINVARELPSYDDVARGVRKGLRRIVESEGLVERGERLFASTKVRDTPLCHPEGLEASAPSLEGETPERPQSSHDEPTP